MKIDHLSPSRLNTWKDCKYHYRLRYHDRVPTDLTTDAAEFGSFMHKVFEEIVGKGASSQEALRKYITRYEFDDKYLPRIKPIMRNFERVNAQLGDSLAEQEFELDCGGIAPFLGIIDRIVPMGDHLLILDYKTGTKELNRVEAHKDPQLMMYAYAGHRISELPFDKIMVCLFYVLSGNLVKAQFEKKDIVSFVAKANTVSQEIKDTPPEEATASPSWKCRWCEYREMCQFVGK